MRKYRANIAAYACLGASAPVRALDQEGESPSMSCLNLLADSNCVTARWGGEQLEANDQSVG